MNDWNGIGRCTKDTELNQSGKVASNTIAIDRPLKDANGNKVTDFINLRFLGENRASNAKKYITKGMKIGVSGSLCIDNYKDKDGNSKQFVYINVSNWEFAESKNTSCGNNGGNYTSQQSNGAGDGFMNIPDGIDEELPFN